MDSITAINIVRDSLRTNLTDPYVTAGGASRTWVWTDEPEFGAKYPRIQVKKIDNPSEILSIGPNYGEREFVYINLWFHSKENFKILVSGTTYKNDQLVEYYLGQIKQTLKLQNETMHTAGAKGYKHMNTTPVSYDSETQLHTAAVTIRVEFFVDC